MPPPVEAGRGLLPMGMVGEAGVGEGMGGMVGGVGI